MWYIEHSFGVENSGLHCVYCTICVHGIKLAYSIALYWGIEN